MSKDKFARQRTALSGFNRASADYRGLTLREETK